MPGFGGEFTQESIFFSVPMPGDMGRMSIQVDGTEAIRNMGANYRRALLPLLIKAVAATMEDGLKALDILMPKDTGEAFKSVKPAFFGVTLETVGGELFSDLDRMPALEFGRAPGTWPPSDRLEQWGRRKFGEAGLGWILAKHVYEHGTPAHHMWEDTFDIIQPVAERRISDAIDMAIRAL